MFKRLSPFIAQAHTIPSVVRLRSRIPARLRFSSWNFGVRISPFSLYAAAQFKSICAGAAFPPLFIASGREPSPYFARSS